MAQTIAGRSSGPTAVAATMAAGRILRRESSGPYRARRRANAVGNGASLPLGRWMVLVFRLSRPVPLRTVIVTATLCSTKLSYGDHIPGGNRTPDPREDTNRTPTRAMRVSGLAPLRRRRTGHRTHARRLDETARRDAAAKRSICDRWRPRRESNSSRLVDSQPASPDADRGVSIQLSEIAYPPLAPRAVGQSRHWRRARCSFRG